MRGGIKYLRTAAVGIYVRQHPTIATLPSLLQDSDFGSGP